MNIRPRKSLLNPALHRPSALLSSPRSASSVWLDKNENFDPELESISKHILASIPPHAVSAYPELGELYRKLAIWLDVDPMTLLVTPGSDGVIRLVFDAFIEQGDWIIHTAPTFAMYEIYSLMFGGNVKTIEYFPTQIGPQLNHKEILHNVAKLKPKILCLPNPDSPSGTVIAPEILKEILLACEKASTLMLIDEAYHPFYPWTAVPWIKESKNLIVARTFSKAWGGAGFHVGYAVGHPDTICMLHKMRPMYELNTISVEYATRMLDYTSEMHQSAKRINLIKKFFQNEMIALGFKALETEGNFIHVAFGDAADLVHTALYGHVLYRSSFKHPSLDGFSRFTIGPQVTMESVSELIRVAIGKNL